MKDVALALVLDSSGVRSVIFRPTMIITRKYPPHDDSTKDPMFWLWLSSTFASQHEDEQSAAAAVAATMYGKSYNKITNH